MYSIFTTTLVTLADSACTSTTDLEITVSQDANEPDMSTSFFSSNAGAFNFNNISIGQTIGFASLSAVGGDINFDANLIVVSILNNQLIVFETPGINESLTLDGTVMGSFTDVTACFLETTCTCITTNASGCDSTATLNLTINNATSSTTDVTVCDSYDWNGTTYTAKWFVHFYND